MGLRHRLALVLAFGASLGGASAAVCPAASPALARVTAQYREYYLADPYAMRDNNEAVPQVASALADARALGHDGAWPDLNYRSVARSAWEPSLHCNRIQAMAIVAAKPATAAADRAALLAAVHLAFAYWIEHDLQCPNWWYNEIGIPKILGTAALVLGDELQPAEYDYMVGQMLARFPIARTGQNRIWLSSNALVRGLLMHDEAQVATAATTIWSEMVVTAEEGLQADDSFHQHGPQQQLGNYGSAFAVEESRLSLILRGSPWAMPPEKFTLLRDYLLQGQNWVSWRGLFDVSACDRQLMPGSARGKTRTIARVMELAAVTDREHAAEYRAYAARNQADAPNDLVGDKYFWRSDYYIHRTGGFAATLKLSSKRVIGGELVNSENRSGYHGADGALYLYASGTEYEDIFPVWDWSQLPGVTCATTEVKPFKTTQVPTDFVGGIEAGRVGLAALDYARDGIKAHKAWFFVPEGVVCLGAGISASGDADIVTTINQARLQGTVSYHVGRSTTPIPGGSEKTLRNADWVEHAGWRYTLLSPQTVHLSSLQVIGSWKKIFDNPDTPKLPVSADVFLLSIQHGSHPANAEYAYAATAEGVAPTAVVLANTPALQAVSVSADQIGIVFWSAGQFQIPHGPLVKVGAPCLVWYAEGKLRVCDPTQKLAQIAISAGAGERLMALPQGQAAGTPATF